MPKKTLPFICPSTGEHFGEVFASTPAQVKAARQDLDKTVRLWGRKPVRERVRIMRQLQASLIDNAEEITAIISKDCGKSRQDAMIEVFMTVDLLNHYCSHAPRWLKREWVGRGLYLFKQGYIEHRPHGVVAIISPWNYPFNLAMAPTIAALLAGNTVMLKPSEVTAATGKMLEDIFAALPELSPFIRVLHGDGKIGAAVVNTAPDYIFLTGSGPTAQKIQRAAAKHLTPVAFELGGKDATIVLEDADIAQAAKWSVWGAFFNAGQTCMGVERVYVVEAVYDEFIAHVVAETKALQMGHNNRRGSPYHLGSLTMPAQVGIVEAHIEEALAKGAQILVGGKRQGMFYEPTVIVNVDHSMHIMQDETFGPVLPIMKAKNEVEAIKLANDNQFGLGGSVWSEDIKRAERVAHRMEAASILINDTITQFAIPMLPFGGVKKSGNGHTHGKAGLMEFSRPHAYARGRTPHPLDVATILRPPGQYHKLRALMHLAFGTSMQQRMRPIREEIEARNSGSTLRKLASPDAAKPPRTHPARLKKLQTKMTGSTLQKLAAASIVGAVSALAFGMLRRGRK